MSMMMLSKSPKILLPDVPPRVTRSPQGLLIAAICAICASVVIVAVVVVFLGV
jgi:hypothetical protein